jgi:hypothetical protein
MTAKQLNLIMLAFFIVWVVLVTIGITEYQTAKAKQYCQTMSDGVILCPDSYPDQGNDQSI